MLIGLLLHGMAYLLPVSVHDLVETLVISATSAFAIAYLATTARRGPHRRFFLAWMAAIGLVIAALAGAARLAAQQNGAPRVDHDLQMPIAGFSGPATSLDGYLNGLRSDYATADRAAAEERRYSAARK